MRRSQRQRQRSRIIFYESSPKTLANFGSVGLVCLGFAVPAIYILVNDCPVSVCVNPILRNQLYAKAHVTEMNRIYSMLLTDNKALIPSFEREECFKQDESYVFVCQTLDLESASPATFSYALSR